MDIYRTKLKILFAGLAALSMIGCSSEIKRTRDSDKTLRVMLDPESIDSKNHVILQNDLISTGKFYVIDRAQAFKAVQKEQERLHKDQSDRFEDKQKYAHWGKLYGVGGIIIAHVQCTDNPSTENILYGVAHLATLGVFHNRRICAQFIELVDSNTGEIVSSIRNDFKTDNENYEMSWTTAVDKLVEAYPKYFEQISKNKILEDYEKDSALEAQKQRQLSSEKEKE
ncbi:MAG: hypothetical protein ACXWQQ_02095 [Pseudobdellovibrio sp.]